MAGKVKAVMVDPDLCVGSTMCVGVDPDAFRLGAEGRATFVGATIDPAVVEDAAELCPVSAIRLVYED